MTAKELMAIAEKLTEKLSVADLERLLNTLSGGTLYPERLATKQIYPLDRPISGSEDRTLGRQKGFRNSCNCGSA